MGLNENVTYNNYERKGLYRDTVGVHKGKSSEALSHEPLPPPNRKQKQNTQSATAGSKNKNEKSPMLHPEARISLMEVHEATVQAASARPSV